MGHVGGESDGRRAYSVHEVAEQFGLSTKAVRRAIARGELRAAKIANRIRVPAEALDAWVEGAEVRAADRAGRLVRDEASRRRGPLTRLLDAAAGD